MKYEMKKVLIADGTPDSQGATLDIELVTWSEGDVVEVRMGFEDDAPVVGSATLSRDDLSVVADFELHDTLGDPDSLTPAVVGMGIPEEFNLAIDYIAVGVWNNADPRIKRLGYVEGEDDEDDTDGDENEDDTDGDENEE